MTKNTKRFKKIRILFDKANLYSLDEALDILSSAPQTNFDQSVEVSLRLGVDPKKSDQQVRGTVLLPSGTGKKVVIVVLAKEDKAKKAKEAGADHAGDQALIDKIKGGWVDFDALVATPDMMKEVGKLGKILGPRGLMPTPKAGSVTNEVGRAVQEIKKGKVEFKVDKNGIINNLVGKLSFTKKQITENVRVLIQALIAAKPSSSKGQYLSSLFVSSTMGPGLKVDLNSVPIR